MTRFFLDKSVLKSPVNRQQAVSLPPSCMDGCRLEAKRLWTEDGAHNPSPSKCSGNHMQRIFICALFSHSIHSG